MFQRVLSHCELVCEDVSRTESKLDSKFIDFGTKFEPNEGDILQEVLTSTKSIFEHLSDFGMILEGLGYQELLDIKHQMHSGTRLDTISIPESF